VHEVIAVKSLELVVDLPTEDPALEPLLRHCSTADLLIEEPYRKHRLAKERQGKLLQLMGIAFVAAMIFCSGLWYWSLEGITDLSVILTVFGVMLGAASIKRHEMLTEAEEMQLYALREIDWLLRERGDR
jgi:cobalamin biosynthesis protein CobD/CbiB